MGGGLGHGGTLANEAHEEQVEMRMWLFTDGLQELGFVAKMRS